MSNTRAA